MNVQVGNKTREGAIARPGASWLDWWALWRLRQRARRLPAGHPVADLIRDGDWAALDRLIADMEGE